MRPLVWLLGAAALLLGPLPAHAEPSRAPASPAGPASGAVELSALGQRGSARGTEPKADCPPLGDNPFDEAEAQAKPPVDLNTADESALLELPGIGPARARAILDFRVAHGGFRSISQLLQIRGIGRALLKQLRPLVTLSR